jgi:small subunit ribosomal protein S7e
MAVKKVVKKGDEKPSDLETAVGQALVDLETHSKDLKADLKDLYIVGAKEVEAEARKCIIVMVPYVQKQAYNKIQNKLIRELEKKFSGKHVFLIAQRTIFSPAYSRKNGGALRPRSRTLTTVCVASSLILNR